MGQLLKPVHLSKPRCPVLRVTCAPSINWAGQSSYIACASSGLPEPDGGISVSGCAQARGGMGSSRGPHACARSWCIRSWSTRPSSASRSDRCDKRCRPRSRNAKRAKRCRSQSLHDPAFRNGPVIPGWQSWTQCAWRFRWGGVAKPDPGSANDVVAPLITARRDGMGDMIKPTVRLRPAAFDLTHACVSTHEFAGWHVMRGSDKFSDLSRGTQPAVSPCRQRAFSSRRVSSLPPLSSSARLSFSLAFSCRLFPQSARPPSQSSCPPRQHPWELSH